VKNLLKNSPIEFDELSDVSKSKKRSYEDSLNSENSQTEDEIFIPASPASPKKSKIEFEDIIPDSPINDITEHETSNTTHAVDNKINDNVKIIVTSKYFSSNKTNVKAIITNNKTNNENSTPIPTVPFTSPLLNNNKRLSLKSKPQTTITPFLKPKISPLLRDLNK